MSHYQSRRTKCFVPSCSNSTSKNRDMVFLHINEHLKLKWCKQLNIPYVPQQRLYCCEDHLNLNEDLENYYEWKFMNVRPRLKSTANLRYAVESSANITSKGETSMQNFNREDGWQVPPAWDPVINLIKSQAQQKTARPLDTVSQYCIESCSQSPSERVILQPVDNLLLKICTATSTSERSKTQIDAATQCEHIEMMDKSTLVKKRVLKIKPIATVDNITTSSSVVSASPSLYGCTSETDVTASEEVIIEKRSRENIFQLINKNSKMYIGVPKQYLWIIKHIIQQYTGVKELDVFITLFKIKQNDSMMRIADAFELSRASVTNSFYCGLEALANYFQNFVYMPTPLKIKQNLPLVFKIRYSNVQCILDAFEIEIEKPNDPQHQAQTWSQYKHCNTIKYLIGCTPNGFISYISKGYGGRISDKALVEVSDLIEILPQNAVVMADRGFKEIEALLMVKNIKLLRPPSVYASSKPTQQEVIQTKVIASLRVHVERVIRRVREFRLLKPHSVVSHKHVGYLDKIVITACGLINLQNEIIKR